MLKPLSPCFRTPRLLSLTVLACVIFSGWLLVPAGHSQLPASKMVSVDALTPLLTQLKKQQDDITANQTKIEAQTDALKEQLRIAKIYSARSR